MKLIDRIRVEGLEPLFGSQAGEEAWEQTRALKQALRDLDLPVVVIDNVADYVLNQVDTRSAAELMWAVNAAPPFPRFWVEWQQLNKAGLREAVGVFIEASEVDDATWEAPPVVEDAPRFANAVPRLRDDFNLDRDQFRWVLRCQVIDASGRKIRGPLGRYAVPVGQDGSLPWRTKGRLLKVDEIHLMPVLREFIPFDNDATMEHLLSMERRILDVAESLPLEVRAKEIHAEIQGLIDQEQSLKASVPSLLNRYTDVAVLFVILSLVAVTFMHCKNVELLPRHPDPKLARKHLKRKSIPLTSYHVLQIDPMRKVLRIEGGMDQGNSLTKALHICRGHFATYSPERPLFGRPQSGPVTVWKPMHVKGRAERGHDQHDYEVKAPSETSGR